MIKRIAIVGGGPGGLFMYKRLVEAFRGNFSVDIFESTAVLGSGMPYSLQGANTEHITNVSGNEIPALVNSVADWLASVPLETLAQYGLDPNQFTEYMVLPRLLFGEYLNAQITALIKTGEQAGMITRIHLQTTVTDIIDLPDMQSISVSVTGGKEQFEFDHVIISTGHIWPLTHEGSVPGYFDSPYPPSKLKLHVSQAVAVRGSSLTAIDAIKTISRHNGTFQRETPHKLSFHANAQSKNFKIDMYSRHGLLPGIRFHLEDPRLSKDSLLSREDIEIHRQQNGGFLSLDFIFEKDFKDPIKSKDPSFYEVMKDKNMEEFVALIMNNRERIDPFRLFRMEYDEAHQSIQRREPVYWKEMLATLSFAMNYPAKHFSAEDMLRLQHTLMPLIAIVIAFVPQSSCEELIALHEAGRLELFSANEESHIEIDPGGGIVYHVADDEGNIEQRHYNTFIDCIGQRHLSLTEFPFKGLVRNCTLSEARLWFKSPEKGRELFDKKTPDVGHDEQDKFYLKVPGIGITDSFRVCDQNGVSNPRVYVMAVPFIGGYNPDYSGLDFCEEASKRIVEGLFGR